MMSDDLVTEHYTQPDLRASIETALVAAGVSLDGLTTADLALVDEFHVGGRPATQHLLDQLELSPGAEVLDIGCGIGGASRLCAETYGAQVTGIDLTPTYVEVAQWLTDRVGLADRVTHRVANAAELPFKKRTFDAAYLLHVGMNVADKTGLFASVGPVLQRGARLGIYDLMRVGFGDLTFPQPWSRLTTTSFLAPADSYAASLEAADFEVVACHDRTEAVVGVVTALAGRIEDGAAPPPLGLHLVMGPDFGTKMVNLATALTEGLIAPVELVAVRTR